MVSYKILSGVGALVEDALLSGLAFIPSKGLINTYHTPNLTMLVTFICNFGYLSFYFKNVFCLRVLSPMVLIHFTIIQII